MSQVKAYATTGPKEPLKSFSITRREPGPHDVVIDIKYCGVCHSDIHQARNEWGGSIFPMVPGHEITGIVKEVGDEVSRFKPGDKVGVGCMLDACRHCSSCKEHLEQYCENGSVYTYNAYEKDGKTPTYGGYSALIVVDEAFVLKIPDNLSLEKAAPLLCAGITTYSPLRAFKIKPGDKVAVVGFGGLGHMAVKLAVAIGAEVTVLSTSSKKKEDALRFGAAHFVNTREKGVFDRYANSFNFMINTVGSDIDLNNYLNLLKLDGTMVVVGIPEAPASLKVVHLIGKRRRLAGSLIGGIKETQEMLDFCSENNITPEIEIIPIEQINAAYERMIKGDVHYRFVIDINSLK